MGSVLICGPQTVSMALTKRFKAIGIRSYTVTNSRYLDTNTVIINKDLFNLSAYDIPSVSIAYYFPEISTTSSQTLAQYRRAYLHGLKHLLSVLPSNTKVVLGSSERIYGNQYGATVNENSPLDTLCPVARVLTKAEAMLQLKPNPHTILRLGTIYTDSANLITRIKKQKIGYSQRQHIMNFIHISDLVSACMKLLNHTGTFIVSDYQPTALNTILSLISSKTGLIVSPPRKHIKCSRGIRLSPEKLLSLGFELKHAGFTYNTQHANSTSTNHA